MSDSNRKTLVTYEKNIQAYIDGTPHVVMGDVKDWLDKIVEGFSKDAAILELGSGFGKDAAYLEKLGYKVYCSDAAEGFVKLLQKKRFKAKLINAITDELGGPYDLVFANVVFLHFTTQEFKTVLNKIAGSLKPNGVLSFSLKRGEGSEWSNEKVNGPRYFQYWTKDGILTLLNDCGYKAEEVWDGESTNPDKIYVVATKIM